MISLVCWYARECSLSTEETFKQFNSNCGLDVQEVIDWSLCGKGKQHCNILCVIIDIMAKTNLWKEFNIQIFKVQTQYIHSPGSMLDMSSVFSKKTNSMPSHNRHLTYIYLIFLYKPLVRITTLLFTSPMLYWDSGGTYKLENPFVADCIYFQSLCQKMVVRKLSIEIFSHISFSFNYCLGLGLKLRPYVCEPTHFLLH